MTLQDHHSSDKPQVVRWNLSGSLHASLASTNPKTTWNLLKQAVGAWLDDDASSLGAALAFYAIFLLAPVLVVAIAVAGAVFGREAAEGEIFRRTQEMIGYTGATAIQAVIENANRRDMGAAASAISIATILLGASGAFLELQSALNKIWRVLPRSSGFWISTLKQRALSFVLVVGTGILLIASLALSAVLEFVGKFMDYRLLLPASLLEGIHFFAAAAVLTVLFATIYRLLPDTAIAWSDVWIGAAVTSLLFSIGKVLIGLYLGRSSVASPYGAAGSVAVLLFWVYYSAQVFLLGAEFTHVYALQHGSRAAPVPRTELGAA